MAFSRIAESAGKRFRDVMSRERCLITPGTYDALSARIAEKAGFEAIAISGFGVETALLGRPDIGLLTMSELVETARRIAGAVDVPITVDADTGFGGVHNIARLVREMEDAGIAGIQLEDQTSPKRCPALEGRAVVSIDEQLVRLEAALAARTDPDFLIIARSDADVVSYDELVRRSNRYLEAGADMAMPICFQFDGTPVGQMTPDEQMTLYARLACDIDGPVKGVLIPESHTATDMAEIGYRVLGLSAITIEAAASAMARALGDLRREDSEQGYRTRNAPEVPCPSGIMDLVRLDKFLAFEARFAKGDG
jgi:2-methylisocitrate lyase-like PEP mutase family enzyme